MNAVGIIAEFNPFHEGHRYLISRAKEDLQAEVCVSVMSGDFCQRGEPCAFSKWERAEEAVKGGVDLVLELPTVYSLGSAEYFARGGVSVLEGLGGLTHLAFGSESGSVGTLQQVADVLRDDGDAVHREAGEMLRQGISYPKARQMALEARLGACDEEVLSAPNNILGIEYLRFLENLTPYTISRKGEGHHLSASRIRSELAEADPAGTKQKQQRLFDLLRYRVISLSEGEINEIAGCEGGLGVRLQQKIRYCNDMESLIDEVKSKAYTRTRIQRMLMNVLLGISQEDLTGAPVYTRVLAMNRQGSAFLKECKKTEKLQIPVIANINKDLVKFPALKSTLDIDRRASDVYNIIAGNDMYRESDFVQMPRMKRDEN